ncbi:hypothetical protein INR49_004636 [Caranx melampygus]|nr:hypothetical protein INR49_004636 [Caranx melampygus]
MMATKMGWRYMGERNSSGIVTVFSLFICMLSSHISCMSSLTSSVPRSFIRTGRESSINFSDSCSGSSHYGIKGRKPFDEEVTGALWAEGQQDALQHCRQHSETQQEGPQDPYINISNIYNYIRFSAICASAVRAALKPQLRTEALKAAEANAERLSDLLLLAIEKDIQINHGLIPYFYQTSTQIVPYKQNSNPDKGYTSVKEVIDRYELIERPRIQTTADLNVVSSEQAHHGTVLLLKHLPLQR